MKHLSLCIGIWTLLTAFSGCVVKEEDYHHYHHHHDRVYIEERPAVIEVR